MNSSDLVEIVPLTTEHFAVVARWLSLPAINRWLTSEWRDRAVDRAIVAAAVRNRRNRLFLVHWESRPCGLVALAELDIADATAMVWYALGEQELSGRGIVSRAVNVLVDECFGLLGLNCVYAWIMEDNLPSRRVLERAGFREAGRLRGSVRSGDRQVDRVYFDAIAADRRH